MAYSNKSNKEPKDIYSFEDTEKNLNEILSNETAKQLFFEHINKKFVGDNNCDDFVREGNYEVNEHNALDLIRYYFDHDANFDNMSEIEKFQAKEHRKRLDNSLFKNKTKSYAMHSDKKNNANHSNNISDKHLLYSGFFRGSVSAKTSDQNNHTVDLNDVMNYASKFTP